MTMTAIHKKAREGMHENCNEKHGGGSRGWLGEKSHDD